VDRVLDEERVQLRRGVVAVAFGAGDEESAELGAKIPQRIQVVAGHAGVEVLAVGDQGAQPVQVGEPVTVLAPRPGRVREPYRQFGVGVEVHSRIPSCRPSHGEVGRVMVGCRYRVLHHPRGGCQHLCRLRVAQ